MRIANPIAALVAIALLGGCNTTRFMANQMVGSLEASKRAFARERSPEQARAAAPASLSMLDGFIESAPHNEDLLRIAAEMNANAAFALIEPREEFGWLMPGYEVDALRDWAWALYAKARRYALRALAEQDPAMAEGFRTETPDAFAQRLAQLEPDDDRLPSLYWAAFASGNEINLRLDDPSALARLPVVLATMERIAELAPDAFLAGAHTFLAVFYSARGPAAGGDLERAWRHYDEVFRRTHGRFLLPYVLFARFYCVALGAQAPERARTLFRKAIRHVLTTPPDAMAEQVLANTIARRWASWIEQDLDEWILPPLPDEPGTEAPEAGGR